MHHTYDAKLCADELMQGDVLTRTPAIEEILKNVHPHFHQHQKYMYFIVLTQSCDLVVRQGGECKARYITLAPVRSLDRVLKRYLAQQESAAVQADLPVLGNRARSRAFDFLARLFNNNESNYFYLEADGTDLTGDCVAYLNLSIALKADLHFESCLHAKILQLDQTFQAKLGWLVGQMYSRVGTQDWDPERLAQKVARTLKDAALWIDDGMFNAVEAEFERKRAADPNSKMTVAEIQGAIKKVPTRQQVIVHEAVRVATGVVGDEAAEKLRRRLTSDAAFISAAKK